MHSNPLPDPGATPGPRYTPTTQGGSRKKVERTLDLLYRRRLIIIVCLLAAGAFSAWQAFNRQPMYQSSAVVMLDLARVPGGEADRPIGDTPFVRPERNVSTELFILNNSRDLANRVNARVQELAAAGELESATARGSVSFGQASRAISSAIQMTATSPDPREAAVLANLYAEEYVRQTQDVSRSYLAASREFLEAQEARRREELRDAEEAVESYMRRTGAVGLTTEGAGLVARISGLEVQRDEAMIDLQMREASLAALEARLSTISPMLVQRMSSRITQNMEQLNTELATLEGERREIESRRAEGQTFDEGRLSTINRRIAAIEAQLRSLAEEYAAETLAVGGIPGSTAAASNAAELVRQIADQQIALQGLRARINSINQRLGQNQGQLRSIPEMSTEVAQLQRTRQHAEQMYGYVMQRLQDARITEESEPGYARVLRRAGVPGAPVGDSPWKGVGTGLLFGLLFGIALAIIRDRLDTRIYKPDQVRDRGIAVTGVIPNLTPFLKEQYGKTNRVEREGAPVSTSLVSLLDPASAPAEAYRHLRTSVQFSRVDQVMHTVLVTSAAASDGKSTTASNLAITMAQSHRRTLLIDADLRRPAQHTMFGVSESPGIAEVLQGASRPADALDAWIEAFRSPHHPELYVLPAGALTGDIGTSAELLGSPRMRDLLAYFRERFDVVVIDTPPVLVATDAVLLATQADATFVVVRAGQTKEGDLEHAYEMLLDVGAHIGGVVLNGFDISQAYGYRYSYGHYSKYGPYSKTPYDRFESRRESA
jgi:polysaccharide biosynthesis transport protein